MKIDIYTHILPAKYKRLVYKHYDRFDTINKAQERRIALTNYEERFRIMDEYEDMVQVVSVPLPPLAEIFGPEEAAEMARIANDGLAELLVRYPHKCIAGIAKLPMNNIDAALKEAERGVKELGFKGIQIYTSVQGKPLSSEEFMPLYEMMSGFDLPILVAK